MLTIHEFGRDNPELIVLFHPLGVWWDIFDYVVPHLERSYHLVIPAMPGHDPDQPKVDYTSVEAIAGEMGDWLQAHAGGRAACLYGCSMGGGVVLRMLAEGRVHPGCAVIDGGMTPYQLPRPLTWLIGCRDWCLCELAKHADVKALRGMFDPDKYSDDDLLYVKKVLGGMSARTIWRVFYSCNNYSMPDPVPKPDCPVVYWYGAEEKKARKWDLAYVRRALPEARIVENPGQGHAEFFTLHPEEFCARLSEIIEEGRATGRR